MSAAQIAANRENAKHSTGPRTETGKSRSARNSTKHGLTSTAVVLPNESQEEYEQFRETIVAGYAPGNDHEHALAVVVAETFWRRKRMYRLETAFMSSRMKSLTELEDADEALVRIFTDPAEMAQARLMLRYVTAAERAYKNAVTELERAQTRRREAEAEQDNEPTILSDGTEASDEFFINAVLSRLESTPESPNGFVSQAGPGVCVASAASSEILVNTQCKI